ncbi:MAG: hypothetical protein OEM51_05425 [Gammaproteobacteria bacterium]|nr:hypothetical protein [Gammaproteobacteria bacterium]
MALAAVLMCVSAAMPAAATTATQAFADGNRLFRDDLYWAALLRYRQAAEAGMDSPLLHYNSGVAHYRAQQHIRARTALLKAARSPGLRVLSQYNLGLNAYAAGDIDDALNWFRQARDQEENDKIRKLAVIAISRLQRERRAADPVFVRVEKERKKRPLTNFDLKGHVGFGTDDNIFRAPDRPYIDFSDPSLPLVTPEEFSGAYLPVDFSARFSVNSLKWESFFGQYRVSGRYYQDKELDSANEFSHEFRFGSEFERREENRRTRVYSAFSIAQHDETYYDPDDGTPRTLAGEPIDDRMNYVRFGPELTMQKAFERLSFGLLIKGQLWNYAETDLVPEYDHEYFLFGGNVQYKFTTTSLLRVSVEKTSRRYGDRPSFDLNAQQLITNPDLRYDYLEVGLLARQRITRNMWFGLGYENTRRTDRYLGYNDYTRDTYSFEYHWSPGKRFDLELAARYRIYDFPNAFAFHNPAAGLKTLETADGEFIASYRLTKHLSMVADAEYRGTSSTDTRIQYDRVRYSIGVVWQQ